MSEGTTLPDVFSAENYMSTEQDSLLFLAILRHKSPELIAMGWSQMNVAQSIAMNSVFHFAAAFGAAYKEAEIALGHPPTKQEMSEFFGLDLHKPGVPRVIPSEATS